jgi:hypothetical protein
MGQLSQLIEGTAGLIALADIAAIRANREIQLKQLEEQMYECGFRDAAFDKEMEGIQQSYDNQVLELKAQAGAGFANAGTMAITTGITTYKGWQAGKDVEKAKQELTNIRSLDQPLEPAGAGLGGARPADAASPNANRFYHSTIDEAKTVAYRSPEEFEQIRTDLQAYKKGQIDQARTTLSDPASSEAAKTQARDTIDRFTNRNNEMKDDLQREIDRRNSDKNAAVSQMQALSAGISALSDASSKCAQEAFKNEQGQGDKKRAAFEFILNQVIGKIIEFSSTQAESAKQNSQNIHQTLETVASQANSYRA